MTVSLPAGIAAQAAQNQLNVALSAIKKSAEADQAVADILQQAADNVPTSSIRGGNVNTSA